MSGDRVERTLENERRRNSRLEAELAARERENAALRDALSHYDGFAEQAIHELGNTNRSKVEFEELIADAVSVAKSLRRRFKGLAAAGFPVDEPAQAHSTENVETRGGRLA